jgi:hypothetical protein
MDMFGLESWQLLQVSGVLSVLDTLCLLVGCESQPKTRDANDSTLQLVLHGRSSNENPRRDRQNLV